MDNFGLTPLILLINFILINYLAAQLKRDRKKKGIKGIRNPIRNSLIKDMRKRLQRCNLWKLIQGLMKDIR